MTEASALTIAEWAKSVVAKWGLADARVIANWHHEYANQGRLLLEAPSLFADDEDSAAELFAFMSSITNAPARVFMAVLRLCPPTNVAAGMIRMVVADAKVGGETTHDWRIVARAIFDESAQMAAAVRKQIVQQEAQNWAAKNKGR